MGEALKRKWPRKPSNWNYVSSHSSSWSFTQERKRLAIRNEAGAVLPCLLRPPRYGHNGDSHRWGKGLPGSKEIGGENIDVGSSRGRVLFRNFPAIMLGPVPWKLVSSLIRRETLSPMEKIILGHSKYNISDHLTFSLSCKQAFVKSCTNYWHTEPDILDIFYLLW